MWRRRRTPRLSVVVPVYRVEAWLPACLDSVLDSQLRDLEVMVVDDGSPDGSGEIAERYAARDRRVRVIHTDNHGLGAARNEGLRHAEGAFVGFADEAPTPLGEPPFARVPTESMLAEPPSIVRPV